MSAITLEVCVDTLDDAFTSQDAGADRIELCSSLELGGLTPSYGLVRNSALADIPVFAMIRARAGDFVYTPAEIKCMLADIEVFQSIGVSGFVFGALDLHNNLHKAALEEMISACNGRPATLNRAFDLSADPLGALEIAIELGFDRVLTSGASASVVSGLPLISKLIEQANNRIIVMPGGGVTPETARILLESLPLQEIHASCKKPVPGERMAEADPNIGRVDSQERYCTDSVMLKSLLAVLRSA